MGYQAPIELRDPSQELWVGEHRPELVDLENLFRHVVHLETAQLVVGPSAVTEAWRKALPEDVHLIRALSPRTVHVHLPRSPVKDIVLKVSLPRPERGLRRITARVERSRSHRAHLWAHRLRALGIATPRPLGFLERASTPARYPSFLATEHVQAPVLIELRDQGLELLGVRRPEAVLQEKRALIVRVAELLRELHANGVFHADLHPGNLLVAPDEVLLLDLEAIRSFAFPERARMKGLVRLARGFVGVRGLTRADRLRFLHAYLRHDADRDARVRALWVRIHEAVQAKLAAGASGPAEQTASSTQPNPAL